MSYSLNETEALCKKAARGAGYSWGLAEEAAKATQWLCRQGIDGCGFLSSLLKQTDNTDLSQWTPLISAQRWQSPHNTLCPIVTGTAFLDRADLLDDAPIVIAGLAEPALMLFFLAAASRRSDAIISLQCANNSYVTDGHRVSVNRTTDVIEANTRIEFTNTLGAVNVVCNRATPLQINWTELTQFASRTYAPDTEQSRLTGAGSGLVDND